MEEINAQYLIEYNSYLSQIKINPKSILNIPKEYITHELCLEAVKRNGWLLDKISPEMQDEEICLAAVCNFYPSIIYIRDEKLYKRIFSINPNLLYKVKPEELKKR